MFFSQAQKCPCSGLNQEQQYFTISLVDLLFTLWGTVTPLCVHDRVAAYIRF